MSLATILLWINAAAFALYGLGFVFWPQAMAQSTTGSAPANGASRTDMRSTYGGCMTALGLWFGWAAATQTAVTAAIVLVLIIMAGMASARIWGMLVDGNANGYIKLALAAELLMAVLAAAAL